MISTRTTRPCLDDQLPVNVRALARIGALAAGQLTEWRWPAGTEPHAGVALGCESHLELRLGAPPQRHRVMLQIVCTPCTFGGVRRWFLCPQCGRRCAVLYAAAGFQCRRCMALPYRSQRQRRRGRTLLRANKIRGRMGWTPGLFAPDGQRPKGMHQRTFARCKDALDQLAVEYLQGRVARRLRPIVFNPR